MKTIKALLARRMKKWAPSQIWIVLTVLVLTLQACNFGSAPYDVYVATDGNDSNDCLTPARACLTIQEGINKADTLSVVHVGAGTFSPASTIYINKYVTVQGAGQAQTIVSQAGFGIGDQNNSTAVIVATLSDLTLSGQFNSLLVRASSRLTGSRLTFTAATSAAISIDRRARIDLTDSIISNSGIGIDNRGVFNGNHLTIQTISLYGIDNNGEMNLQNTTVEQVSGGAAINNETGSLSFSGGTIANNASYGLINRAGGTATIMSTAVNHNVNGVTNSGTMTMDSVEAEDNTGDGIASFAGSIQIARSASVNNLTGIRLGQPGQPGHPDAVVVNSTISGNQEGMDAYRSSVYISFSTIAFNLGGGIYYAETSQITVNNSIIGLNGGNCQGTGADLFLAGANLACDDSLTNATLQLDSLTLAAGTKVHPLLSGSTAIDRATGSCPSIDQRAYARPHGTACDIGAFEFGSAMALVIATPGTPELLIIPTIPPTTTATPVQKGLEIVTAPPAEGPKFTLKKNAFCRKGPDVAFPDISAITAGETVDILNVSEDGFWYFVDWQKFKAKCWVAAGTGDINGDVTGLKVLVGPSLPTPKPDAPSEPKPVLPPACTSYADASSCTTNGCNWDKSTSSCH